MFYDYCPNIQPTPWKEYQTTQKSVQNFKPNLHSLHELVIVRFLKLDNTDVLRRIIVCCVSCALWSVVPSLSYTKWITYRICLPCSYSGATSKNVSRHSNERKMGSPPQTHPCTQQMIQPKTKYRTFPRSSRLPSHWSHFYHL